MFDDNHICRSKINVVQHNSLLKKATDGFREMRVPLFASENVVFVIIGNMHHFVPQFCDAFVVVRRHFVMSL